MKRLTPALIAGLLAWTLVPTVARAADEVVLKVHHFLPPMSPAHTKFIQPWCDKLAKESGDKLKCQIYPAMQLGGTPPQLFEQAKVGVADVVWTLPGYTAGRFPTSEVFELPFMSTTHEGTTRAAWDFVQQNAQSEFKDVKLIGIWTNGPNYLHLKNKQVNNLADLKGLKIRAPSRESNKTLAALGASPVGMPAPQMSEAISKGVIDGGLIPWEVVPALKLHELVKFHAETPAGHALATSTMIFVMNKAKYDALAPELKKVIDANSGQETSAWIAAQFAGADAGGRKAAEGRGNTIYALPASEMVAWQKAAEPVVEEWIKAADGRGQNGKALVESARALVKKYTR